MFSVNEVPQFRAQASGINGYHFWRVSCLDGDVLSDWRPTGFNTDAQDVDIFSTDGVSNPETGRCRIEINAAPVNIPGFANPVSNDDRFLPGQAWRIVKDAGVGSGGTFRVRVGVFPSDWGFQPPTSEGSQLG